MGTNIEGFVVDNSFLIECIDAPARFPLFFSLDTIKYAPNLMLYELSNVLLSRIKKDVFTPERGYDDIIARVLDMIHFENYPDRNSVLSAFYLSKKHNLTFYDASYLQLAIDLQIPLATYDQQLTDAAKAEKVKLIG